MNIQTFLAHHGIRENPFSAEEARHDPIFERIVERTELTHPNFSKILGRIDRPNTSIVFGEKGSGKTAIRLLIGRKVEEHNRNNSDRRILLIAYDDLNPVLDQLLRSRKPGASIHGQSDAAIVKLLNTIRLEDHQDAILSMAVTQLNDALLGGGRKDGAVVLPEDLDKRMKKLPRRVRVDWAALTALYDQPRSGSLLERWGQVRRKLRLGWRGPFSLLRMGAILLTLLALGLWFWTLLANYFGGTDSPAGTLMPIAWACGIGAVVLWGWWLYRYVKLRLMSRRLQKEMGAIGRTGKQLHQMLDSFRSADLIEQPWPTRGDDENSRYELTHKLLEVLDAVDHAGIIVLVDRVDEPTVISGEADRMKAVIWPMFDNKFLQQDRIGFKLLLPIELRHLMHKESAEFFQEARFDKASLVDRLEWSGATLYDLCTERVHACQQPSADPISLMDLFEDDVTQDMIVDALDQMHQPRDAFKFLYSVLQEHCSMVPEDNPKFQIPRLTLETIRKSQAQRVQELYRGLSPA